MTDDLAKQAAYEAKRRSRVPATHATFEYRVWMPDGTVFTERAIGPSQIVAHYPQLIALRVVGAEPTPGMMGEMW